VNYSQFESNEREISRGDYQLHQLGNFITDLGLIKPTEKRGSQPGGFTFTSEFAQNLDGPKTDATKGSSGSVNIDGIMAAFNAVKMSPEAPKFVIDDLPEWATMGKDLADQTLQNKDKSSNERTTKVCYDCFPGDRVPEYGTDAYLIDENGKVTDTLKRNSETGKVDTLPVKKEK